MKQIMKRTMSLALSGVLLLSSVPVQALATEEITIQEIPAVVAPLANEVTVEIKVNGTTDPVEGVTCEGNKVTLSGVTVDSVESNEALEIALTEGATTTIKGALVAVKGIKITGKGILKVGSIQAGENLMIEDARVEVGAKDKETDAAALDLIKVKNEITVSGEAHVVTASGHNAVVFENGTGKVSGGFWRNAKDGDFTDYTAAADCDTYFEAVAADHVTGENPHVLSCKCDDPTKVIIGEHNPAYDADGAVLTCSCDVCGKDLGKLTVKDPADLTWNGLQKEVTVENELPYPVELSEVKYHEGSPEGAEKVAVEPGTYAAVVTVTAMEEDYELRKVFVIEQKELNDSMVALSSETVAYDGSPRPLPTVTVNDGSVLVENTDYSVAYTRNGSAVDEAGLTDVGTVKVTVTGKGNYKGKVEKTFTIQQADATAALFECTMPAELTYNGQAKKADAKVGNDIRGMGDISLKYYRNGEAVEPVAAGTYVVAVCVEGNGNYKQAEIKDAAWTFTIEPVAVTNTDGQAVPAQTVVAKYSAMAIQKPSFTGVNGETVTPENVSYTLEGSDVPYTYDQLIGKLKTEPAGKTVKISYTAEAEGNYSGTITGEITVKLVDLEFTVGEEAATAENAVTIIEEEKRVYGQEGIVTVKDIKVTAGDKTDAAPQFTVLYQVGSNEKKSQPDAGENTFYVMYSGTIDGVAYENIEVCKGSVTVNKRPAAPEVTAVTGLTDGEQDRGKEMLTVTTKGEKVRYSVNDGPWTEAIPTVKESGVYTVKYKVDESKNIIGKDDFAPVKVVVAPYITATYGDTLEKVQGTISTSQGTWTFNAQKNPLVTKVGPVNETGNEFHMDFKPKDATEATETEHPVKIFVEPAHIRVSVEVNDRYLPHAEGKKVEATVTVRNVETNEVIASADYTTVCTNITNTQDQEVINPGKAKITVQAKTNYVFENDAADLSKEYIVYDNTAVKLLDAWTYADYGNDDMAAAGFSTGKDVKEKLDKVLDEDLGETDKKDYPATKRKYYDFLMKDNSEKKYTYDLMYWPADGLEGSVAYINSDADKTDTFKIYAMYTVDSDNTAAGTVVELTEAEGKNPGVNEYKLNDKTISVNLKHYAAVCIALKENTTKEYSVKAESEDTTKGTVSFKVGTSSSAKVAKKGDKITVTVSPKSTYELSRLNYTYNNGTEDVTVAIDKDSSGKYTFEMPAASVVINAKFAKKAGNASTGDTSNIQLWVTMLAASGVAIVAVILFWLKKRKK